MTVIHLGGIRQAFERATEIIRIAVTRLTGFVRDWDERFQVGESKEDWRERWFRESLELARYYALRTRLACPTSTPLPKRGRATSLCDSWRVAA